MYYDTKLQFSVVVKRMDAELKSPSTLVPSAKKSENLS